MSILRQIFESLREYYAAKPDDPQLPENPIEVILGAILVQASTWKQVDKVLDEFRAKEMLDFGKIALLAEAELAAIIRPVGFQTKKARRITAIAKLILERGDLDRYFARDVEVIRRELLSISGIGYGTADNILLYAGQVPIYVVDTFTSRVLIRHGFVTPHASETQIQELIHRELTPDEEPYGAKLFQKMQEYLVRIGRDFCDGSRPDCRHCPLNIYLPEGEAIEPMMKGTATKPKVSPSKSVPVSKPVAQPLKPVVQPPIPVVQPPKPVPPVVAVELNETERKIVAAIGEEPVAIDEVVLAVQLPVHIVRATIAVLQMKKVVCQVEGNRVKRV